MSFETSLTQDEFEEICSDIWSQMLAPIQDALQQAALTESDIEKVIVVGGSSRIPKVRSTLQDHFGKSKVHIAEQPEQAIAEGAAWLAFSRANPEKVLQLTFMGLGDPEARQLETSDYPAFLALPNPKFINTFFRFPRKSPRNAIPVTDMKLESCDSGRPFNII